MVAASKLLATAVIVAVAVVDCLTDIASLPRELKKRVFADAFDFGFPAFGLGREPREFGCSNLQGNRFDPHAIPCLPKEEPPKTQPKPEPTEEMVADVGAIHAYRSFWEMGWFLRDIFWNDIDDDVTIPNTPVAEETGRTCRKDANSELRDVCYEDEN